MPWCACQAAHGRWRQRGMETLKRADTNATMSEVDQRSESFSQKEGIDGLGAVEANNLPGAATHPIRRDTA